MASLTDLMEKNFVMMDGGMGTMLQQRGLAPGERTEMMNISAPYAVEEVHRLYHDAGSMLIAANTFGVSGSCIFSEKGRVKEIISNAMQNVRKAAPDAAAALDIGPTGAMLEPFGDLAFEDAYDIFKCQAIAAEEAGADLALVETMSDPNELEAAVLAVKENTSLPVIATMTFTKEGFTFMGCSPEQLASLAEKLSLAAVGLNCSLSPEEMYPVMLRLAEKTALPLVIKPNAGLPDAIGGYAIGPEEFAQQMRLFKDLPVKFVGGCCGTTPDYIKVLCAVFDC